MRRNHRAAIAAFFVRARFVLAGAVLAAACVPAGAESKRPAPSSLSPLVESLSLVALDRKRPDGVTARLDITYRKGQNLPDGFPIHVLGKPYPAKRVRSDVFSVEIPFDFEAFVAEQKRRAERAPRLGKVPVFSGREVVAHKPLRYLDPERLKASIAAGKPIQVEPEMLGGFSGSINAGHSLLVTDVSVVEDPQRTYDACSGQGNPAGAWTFGRLMENIANTPVTGVHAADLAEDWILSFASDHLVNGFAVPNRSYRAAQLLDHWPRDANNRLKLDQAPFRLLGIVNRIDLRKGGAYGGGTAGEGRFVFGIMERQANGQCIQSFGTIILEYGIPLQECEAVRDYGEQWAELSNLSLGSPAYNSALQAITDGFTAANRVPSKPNGSALNQLRINDFPIQDPWELRELRLSASTHLLETVSTALTPHLATYNDPFDTRLGDFINRNEALILQERHDIPLTFAGAPFLTGSAMNPHEAFRLPLAWKPSGVNNPDARHRFAINTCNGCHGQETRSLEFVHIGNRNMGTTAFVSEFLIGSGSVSNPNTFTIPDPVHPSISREFGELVRRVDHLEGLVSRGCSSGGLLHELQHVPMNFVH